MTNWGDFFWGVSCGALTVLFCVFIIAATGKR